MHDSTLLCSLVIVGCFSLFDGTASEPPLSHSYRLSSESVMVWNPVEIHLQALDKYANAYLEVDVNATLTAPSGHTLTTPGFWSGEQEWVIRFAPNEPGQWQFTTSCSTRDRGLCGVAGRFSATPYSGSLLHMVHGFLKVG